MTKIGVVSLLLILHFLQVVSQSSSFTLSDSVSSLTVGGDRVFASTGTYAYRLSSDLQQQQQTSLTNQILRLAATQDGQWLVVCYTNGSCSALNGSDLSITNRAVDSNVLHNVGNNDKIAVFTAPVSGGESFYTGSFNIRIYFRQYGFAGSSLLRTNGDNQVTSATFQNRNQNQNQDSREFYGGFYQLGYAYYIVTDSTSGNDELRIVRVCNSTADSGNDFSNQYEVVLGCDGNTFFAPTIKGVSVLNGETLLIAITPRDSPSRVCSYNLTIINSRMDNAYQSCVKGNSGNSNIQWQTQLCSGLSGTMCDVIGNYPAVGATGVLSSNNIITNITISNGLTSILGLTVDDLNFIYITFSDSNKHYINKYLWNNGNLSLITEVEMSSSITNLTWSEGSDYIYGINGTTDVIGLKIEECSSATSCNECVSLGNPLCGWCVVEGKCSRRPFCQDSDVSGRFLTQENSDSCIDTIAFYPARVVLELESMPYQIDLTFSPAGPPPKLSGEEYFCVFNNTFLNIEILSPLQVNGTSAICQVDNVISQVTDIQLVTNFSIYSNHTGVKFFIHNDRYIFYNCAASTKCSPCVSTDGICGWCQLDFTCTGDNSTCTGGDDNWIRITDEENSTDLCPLLQPPLYGNSYSQPVSVSKNLQLRTLNTMTSGITYQCVFGNMDRTGIQTSDNIITCNIPSGQELSFSGGHTQTQTHPFILRQISNTKSYDIETTTGDTINVVLYNCPTLANGCSSCLALNINTGFNCSWCDSNMCSERSVCTNNIVTMNGDCPNPVITNFTPTSGPPQGRTHVTINGTNLGTQSSDILSVTLGSRTCTSNSDLYVPGTRIVCSITPDDSNTVTSNVIINVTVNTTAPQPKTAVSSTHFQFLTPIIQSVNPTFGPASGGTLVRVEGTNLDIGNKEETKVIMRESSSKKRRKRNSHCPDIECNIMNINSTQIQCTSANITSINCTRTIIVSVNEAEFSNSAVTYLYKPDPTFSSLTPEITIPAGGIKLNFTGTNVDVIQSPMIRITDSRFSTMTEQCVNISSTKLQCIAPPISGINVASDIDTTVTYTLILDGVTSPDSSQSELRLTLKPDPIFNGIINAVHRTIIIGQDSVELEISGENIESVDRSEIRIFVGEEECTLTTTSSTTIDCRPPTRTTEGSLSVRVEVGENLVFPSNQTAGAPEWTVTYKFQSDNRNTLPLPAIGGAVGGVVILLIGVVIIVIVCALLIASRQAKVKDMRFTSLLAQMETMEMEMADQCKQAFAELQTDLGELVTDDALEGNQLPFHNFPTYATKVFFPSVGIGHPVLSPPRLPPGMTNHSLLLLLEDFKELVFNKKFLVSFIKTLEAQPRFSLQEKSTMASLLMVACMKDINYATEILQILLGDLIRRSISNSKNHPKLLLRRTESVAEKLLTNWFCVTLYPYIIEHAGAPLFVLFKAVKAQLEKGPIDVITGEARNSLSEEKLLRQALEFKVLECEVEMGCPDVVAHSKEKEAGLEPRSDDIQTIRLLDTDSISQTKEKLLDFIYRNRPVSHRPSIGDVELELCRGNAGISLKDQDATSTREGEWMKINTLAHFNIPEMASSAIEDPKKPTPRFRITRRPDRPTSVPGYDVPGTIIASASITSQTSLLAAAATQSYDASTRLFHLVKPDFNEDQSHQKIVSEVFLTRLLSTKRILQPYVDDLFHAIFTVPHGKPLPKAIKLIFDFLDTQAAELSINDPEVLHTWKTNTLPLRFWVNLIKNPDFIFDINKSATIDACFTVIAQAYIDACSTADVKYTKDTPSARLLYANEVKQYKTEVLQYYSTIQSLPHNTTEESREYFNEMFETHFQDFESQQGMHFHSDSALLEMYRYAVQYGDELVETLTEERLNLMANQFDTLRKKYDINSSAM